MNKFIVYLMSVAFMAATFAACSDDGEPEPTPNPKDEPAITIDELGVLQDNLVVLNEDGSIKERVYGVVLDESTPNTVSIGVDDFDEAREIFSVMFADTTLISNNGTLAQFSTRQGKAELIEDKGTPGLVAHAVFDVEGLKWVDRINFIAHSAWPENTNEAFSPYKVGIGYEMEGLIGKTNERYVCVRQYKEGSPAILVAITKDSWCFRVSGYWRRIADRSPCKKNAQMIAKILQARWDFFKSCYNVNGMTYLHENYDYWIDEWWGAPAIGFRWTINLKNSKLKRHDVMWRDPKYFILLYTKPGLAS